MNPEDEVTDKNDGFGPFGTTPRRPQSVYDAVRERYDIVKELGAGGMGVVLHVFDRITEEDVALKLIRAELARRPELVQRFKREVRLARQITHKRVCRTYELLRFADTFAISMEYVDGDTLRELLRRLGGLGSRTVMRIAEETCSALQEAHEHGIVHRDLKPENIMLDREGHVKVMDFGIAHSVTLADTSPGDVIGTPHYMAPEQLLPGSDQIDARTDIYLLGLLLYEMYTGSAAGGEIKEGRFEESLNQHRDVIPESSVQVIKRCLQHQPSARFQSANEVALGLRIARVPETANVTALPLHLRLIEVALQVEDELINLNSNLEGPCKRTETWQQLPTFLLDREVINVSIARSLELFRSIVSFSDWKVWPESKMAKTIEEGQRLIEVLKAIPTPEFTVEEINIILFQDEACIIPLQQPLGVRVNIRYSDGSNASRVYPAGRKFYIGESVRPWWDTRRPYTRLYCRDSSGRPGLAWGFAFPFVGLALGAPTR